MPIDFHIFDELIFLGPYNQISILGNMQGRAGLLVRHSLLDLSIGGFTGVFFSCHFTISISFCSIDLCISSFFGIYFHSGIGS